MAAHGQLRLAVAGAATLTALAAVGGSGRAARALPDACAVPDAARVVHVVPSDDLSRVVSTHPPRTIFCLAPGVHRLSSPVVPEDDDVFVGRRGAVVSGAREITHRFRRAGDAWVAAGQTQENPRRKGQCAVGRACRWADDVFMDGRPLRRVLNRAALRPGRFYFDYARDRIWLGSDPQGRRVEAAVVTRAFRGSRSGADRVRIIGLVVEGFANAAQIGAINGRANWTVERCEVRLNHGIGIQDVGTVVRNHVHDNGQLGVGGDYLTDAVVAHNRIHDNNYAGFDPNWEAGGGKWLRTTRLIVRDNEVRANRGPGLWTDTDNVDTVVAQNRVVGNSGPGILHEISYSARINLNVVVGNGHAPHGWVDGAGILVNSSSDVFVHDNRVRDNGDGIGLVQTDRGSGRNGPYLLARVRVYRNNVTMRTGHTGIVNNTGDSAIYTRRGNRFEGNRYVLGCEKRSFAWRPPSGKTHYAYVDLAAWRAAGNDRDGRFTRRCAAPR